MDNSPSTLDQVAARVAARMRRRIGQRGPGPASRGRSHVLALAGAMVLLWILGGLMLVAYQSHERQMEAARANNALLARLFADHANRSIEAASLAGVTLAELLHGGLEPDAAEFGTALRQTLVNLPFLRGLAVLDSQGYVMASTERRETGRVLNLKALGVLPVGRADRLGPYVPARTLRDLSTSLVDTFTPAGAGFLPLIKPVALANGSKVWLVALINAQSFASFQQVTLGDAPARATALLDFNGRLISSTGRVPHAVGDDLSALAPFTSFLPRLESGDWVGPGLQHGAQVAAFHMAATRPLVVVVEEARSAVRARWLAGLRGLVLAGLMAGAVIVGMTVVAWRSVRSRERARQERDQALQAVVQRERALSITLKSVQELIFRTDARGHISFVNERWTSFTGQPVSEARGPLWDMLAQDCQAAVRGLFSPQAQSGLRRTQARLANAQGGALWLDFAVMPLHHDGQLVGFAGSAVDVTARLQAKQQLQEQLSFVEQLMDASPLPMSVMTTAGRYVLVNRAWEDFTGRSRADVVGTLVGQHLTRAEQQVHEVQDRALQAHGQPIRYETTARHREGTVRDVVVNKLLLPSESGHPSRIMAVLMDVTEFRDAERATREARDAAEEASRSKSEFIANISHELRTPLQTIIGFSELGQVRGGAQPKLAAMFGDINGAGQRMQNLVNDLLDVSKIESAVGAIHLERSDLRVLLHNVTHEMEPLLSPKQLHVQLHLPDEPLTARVDPTRFQQVVRNVLANAVKFSPHGGLIELGGEHNAQGEPRVWVRDNGPGIPEAELERIFEAFVQSSRTKDGSGGTGLGLAICRTILQAHGGQIEAKNRAGGGSEFLIRLPARGQTETLNAPL
jgi:PAS domain S-box-containing protein